MKKTIFFILSFIFILCIFFVSRDYSFQFGFGTKGFIRRTLEKGQQEGKIPKTKEEKKEGRPVNVNKLDLSGAKYLFVSAKKSQSVSSVMQMSPAIYHDSLSQGTTQQSVFKIKEDGSVEEVKIYDTNGNLVNNNVLYMIKMGTSYICIELELLQTQKRNKYLVKLEDGAAWAGDMLPGKDTNTDKVEYDNYGNYYYFVSTYSNMNNVIVKLNTTDMSYKMLSLVDDKVLKDSNGNSMFWVDKFGNILYAYEKNNQKKYRFIEVDSEKGSPESETQIKDVFINPNRDTIFYIIDGGGGYFSMVSMKYNYGQNPIDVDFQFTFMNLGNLYYKNIIKGCAYDNNILLMFDTYSLSKPCLSFASYNLTNNTTDYIYEIPLSSFNVGEIDYNYNQISDYFNNSFSYKIVNSTTVYVMFKTKDGANTLYSFFIVYPNEQRFEQINRTYDDKIRYEINANFSKSFDVDVDGNIIVSANDMQNNGVKVILKILKNSTDGKAEQIYTGSKVEIQYLTRVR